MGEILGMRAHGMGICGVLLLMGLRRLEVQLTQCTVGAQARIALPSPEGCLRPPYNPIIS